jgi:hypothetical protein
VVPHIADGKVLTDVGGASLELALEEAELVYVTAR